MLDGQTNQALACVRSLGAAGCEVFVASRGRWPLAAWSRHCRGSFRLGGEDLESFAELRGWARRRGVRFVLPLTERSCVLANAGRGGWEAAGVAVGCGPAEMLEAAFDKALTVRHAEACGVRVPRTCVPSSLDDCLGAAEEIGFPCVVKPRRSNAWDGARFSPTQAPVYVKGREELRRAVAAFQRGGEWPLVQAYVEGRGKGIFALCDGGRVVARFAHERLRDTRPTGSGSSLRRSVAAEPRFAEPAARLLAALSWHGPAMVEFKDDGAGEPCLMEVNGRFWGSLQLGVDAGVDFPLLWLSTLKGERVAAADDYAAGVTLRWLWGDVKRLLHIAGGPPPGYPGSYPTLWQGLKEFFGPQPAGTRLEMWRAGDPGPAVGEWVEGVKDLLTGSRRRGTEWLADRRQKRPAAIHYGGRETF